MWGPSDLKYLVDAMKSFIPHTAMVHAHSFGEAQSDIEPAALFPDHRKTTEPIVLIDDEVVRLSATPLRPTQATGMDMSLLISLSCTLVNQGSDRWTLSFF